MAPGQRDKTVILNSEEYDLTPAQRLWYAPVLILASGSAAPLAASWLRSSGRSQRGPSGSQLETQFSGSLFAWYERLGTVPNAPAYITPWPYGVRSRPLLSLLRCDNWLCALTIDLRPTLDVWDRARNSTVWMLYG